MTKITNSPTIVDDLVTYDVVTVRPDDTVGNARDLTATLGFHAVPVVEDDQVVGIVTSADLADGWSDDHPISGVMSSPVYRIRSTDSLRPAAEEMLNLRVHHLVVEDREGIGILSSFDLLRALI